MENKTIAFIEMTDNELEKTDGGALAPPIIAAIIAGTIAAVTWGYGQVKDHVARQGYLDGYNSK